MKQKVVLNYKKSGQLLLFLVLFLLIMVGATYAYFVAQKGKGTSAYININSDTTDSLTFAVGESINISASAQDFYEGGEDKTGTTTATARLVPNNTNNEAHEKYNVYFIIDANDFTYTTPDEEVELLLKVKDPNGNPLTNIEALNYDTNLNGFDITKRQGAFKVTVNDDIDATSEEGTIETWSFEVVLRNLSTNQHLNTGKSFSGKVLITTGTEETYIVPELNNIIEEQKNYDSITVSLVENEQHTAKIDKYYYAIEETDEEPESATMMSIAEKLEPNYQPSDKNSYTFNNLRENQNYKIYAYAEDVQGIRSEVKTVIVKTDEYTRVQVTDVSASEITQHSIKVKATATNGTNNIKEYGFKITDNEDYKEWKWQESSEFTFTNLKAGNTYKIQVTARDELNKEAIGTYDKDIATTPYTVTVQVTGGTSNPPSMTVVENGIATFQLAAIPEYDVTSARVINGDGCILSADRTTLTVSDVTSDKTCTVEIYKTQLLNQFIISKVNTNVGQGTLAQHTASLPNSAGDNSYRYSGDNPNNYVCFGNGSEEYNNGGITCPDANLYRIIGVFGEQVKLIKSEYATEADLGIAKDVVRPQANYNDNLKRVKTMPIDAFFWNKTRNNTWETSTLFLALNNATNGYLKTLGESWTNKIVATTWHAGGHNTYDVNPKVMHDNEINSVPTVAAKIGLMYASDYGFASSSDSWGTSLFAYNTDVNRLNNWLYNNIYEWTISPYSSTGVDAFHIDQTGYIYSTLIAPFGVRPVFYLNTNVKIKIDNTIGDVNSPYRIVP